jgi:hypothetical protein
MEVLSSTFSKALVNAVQQPTPPEAAIYREATSFMERKNR